MDYISLSSKPCGFESAYLELANAVKEEYPDIEIESRLGGTGMVTEDAILNWR